MWELGYVAGAILFGGALYWLSDAREHREDAMGWIMLVVLSLIWPVSVVLILAVIVIKTMRGD